MDNEDLSINRWIIIFFLVVIISVSMGLIFAIPVIQITAAVFITLILVISAFVFQRMGSKSSRNDDKYGNYHDIKTDK